MPACKVCGHWFVKIKPQEELCDKCESALYRLSGYVAPVVHGEWEQRPNGEVVCSRCGALVAVGNGDALKEAQESQHFCFNCGAKMDEGAK